MSGRNPLGQGYIAEHRRLLLIVSTHGSFINPNLCGEKVTKMGHFQNEFFRSL